MLTHRLNALLTEQMFGQSVSSTSLVSAKNNRLISRPLFARALKAVVLALGALLLTELPVEARNGVTTHLLAVGICPPWKDDGPEPCINSVEAVSRALQKRLDIDDINVSRLVNAKATAKGLSIASGIISA